MENICLRFGELTLKTLRSIANHTVQLSMDNNCRMSVESARNTVADFIARGQKLYGVNTGFGSLAEKMIDTEQLQALQKNLVLSHAAGIGDCLPDKTVALIIALKANSLARGYSGVRPELIDALIKLVNAQVYPCIPEKGSVGASGDLAPLAHLTATLLGEGNVRINNKLFSAKKGLHCAGMKPIELAPKEGLALLNGTQVSTALALQGLFSLEKCLQQAIVIGSLSTDAVAGRHSVFDERIQMVRGHQGQIDVAQAYRELLADSEIRYASDISKRLQDPYSIRCQAQVMGACLDQWRFVANTLETEANAVTDNPIVFPEQDDIISGGNFHAEPIALAADGLALCFAEIGALSERRIALLIDANLSGLPPFLVEHSGINSGFMVAQVTAASLASENKSLAHPASVDSLPTSANQEDHVSMATFAARRLMDMADNTFGILAIECLAACQGLEFRRPKKTSPQLEAVHALVRESIPIYQEDRSLAPDIASMKKQLANGVLMPFIEIK